MDTTQALRDTENALRDLIYEVLSKQHGTDWERHLGITDERMVRWKKRRSDEQARQKGAPTEDRLLYYADFYDLWEIIRKNWLSLKVVLGEQRTIEVWLAELERLRDPNAHSRDLLPFQKHLILGISGDIRGRIVRYRSKMDSVDDYFPKIESARDSVGHSWTPASSLSAVRPKVREGDLIEFVVTATDPMGAPLEYGYKWHPLGSEFWTTSNTFTLTVDRAEIGLLRELHIRIRGPREPRARHSCDDFAMFHYDILPRA